MTRKLGFLGTGKITSAVVRGLAGVSEPPESVVVSPRNAERAAVLSQAFGFVRVARDNQDVVDSCDVLFLAVRPSDAPDIVPALRFRQELRVVSLMPTIAERTLASWVAPARVALRACPLPSCASRRGPILVWGNDEETLSLLGQIGELVSVDSEESLHRVWVISGVISPIYDVLASIADWTRAEGVDGVLAERYVAAMTQSLCELRLGDGDESFADLAQEAQTPGGLNEQAAEMIRRAGAPQAFSEALDALLRRFESSMDS